MCIFKSKIEKLKLQIPEENYALLLDEEKNDKYYLQKMIDWQEDYSQIEWNEFKDYSFCNRCKGYDSGQCICYAR